MPARPRGQETVGDMLRSLGIILGVVLLIYVLLPKHHHSAVHAIDFRTDLASARHIAHYHVLAPVGLPTQWRATSTRVTHQSRAIEFDIGFVTPHNQYAEVAQSDEDAAVFVPRVVGANAQQLGTTTVGQAQWQELRDARGELALVDTTREPTVVVTGSASLAELQTLARSLR